MASIFTYETEPVKLASPWPRAAPSTTSRPRGASTIGSLSGIEMPSAQTLEDFKITRLEAEPQEGPTEYKLHLLLRPRRTLSSTSTVQRVSGSHLSKSRSSGLLEGQKPPSTVPPPTLTPTYLSRQNRLQHLTTQLLWRLQQSSSNHCSSKADLILPLLPEADVARYESQGPRPLVAGLDESLGSLYEIGVSDDGTFVGLTLDELVESLRILRAMAHSLGCILQVTRLVEIGNCQWSEDETVGEKSRLRSYSEKLWVAEVLILPHHGSSADMQRPSVESRPNERHSGGVIHASAGPTDAIEYVRISLTGSTTSGKSSLLGTLSTSTLDNGRGKSRLSLLKHHHEIVSGVTSSLAQELIGYQDVSDTMGLAEPTTSVINYASGNISSWTDIHNSSGPGRLVFVTDSAGHPKFRRTTVRSLLSWAPQWTLCCIAADDEEEHTGKLGATASSNEVLGSKGHAIDLSKAHLEMCLKLDLPLVVIITKLDLASRNGLRQTFGKVLSTLKSAGRKPASIAVSGHNTELAESQSISQADNEAVRKALGSVDKSERHLLVPVIFSSVVDGRGIGQIHALLRQLPVPNTPSNDARKAACRGAHEGIGDPGNSLTVFHVDEIFATNAGERSSNGSGIPSHARFVLSGYACHGILERGDNLLLGPFNAGNPSSRPSVQDAQQRTKSFSGLSKSLPKDLTVYARSHQISATNDYSSHDHLPQPVWQPVRIVSLRHLRLPVHILLEGQVGTVGILPSQPLFLNADPCLRRGMILASPLPAAGDLPPAYTRITAVFANPNIYVNPSSSVIIYTASIRAPARIVEVRVPEQEATADHDTADILAFNEHDEPSDKDDGPAAAATPTLKEIEIVFQFTNSREWVEMGTKLLVTPAGGISMVNPPSDEGTGEGNRNSAGNAHAVGLEGFVGKIVRGSA